ncbi:MAG TPA: hypothetical protein VJ790_20145 [Dongiaceae bacterium]|nr:hypothetical protein [Dongiaceae bacterium]
MTTDRELQGWYYRNRTSDAERVRLSFVGDSLALHTLSERLVATWSLDQLENREFQILGDNWSIGDRRLPESYLVLENDDDYRALRGTASRLRPVRARLWRLLGIAAVESGNRAGWPVLLLLIAAAVVGLSHVL